MEGLCTHVPVHTRVPLGVCRCTCMCGCVHTCECAQSHVFKQPRLCMCVQAGVAVPVYVGCPHTWVWVLRVAVHTRAPVQGCMPVRLYLYVVVCVCACVPVFGTV